VVEAEVVVVLQLPQMQLPELMAGRVVLLDHRVITLEVHQPRSV
jgi:hypothetical protein